MLIQGTVHKNITCLSLLIIFMFVSIVAAESEVLFDAVISGDLNNVVKSVKEGADVRARDSNGYTALHWAASEGHAEDYTEIVNYLLRQGAEVNAQENKGDTPLHFAAYTGSLALIKCLVQAGANVNARNFDGETPLHIAAKLDLAAFPDAQEIFDYLAESGAPKEEVESFFLSLKRRVYQPPIVKAVEDGDIKELERLVQSGARVDADSKSRYPNLLQIAAERGYLEIVKYLVDRGVEIDSLSIEKAAKAGKQEVVEYLRSKR